MADGIFFYTDEFQRYDMGPQHPLRPIRLTRTFELIRSYRAFETVGVETPEMCPIDDLVKAHSREYVDVVDRLSVGQHVPLPFNYGFDTGDNPAFPGMFDASRLYTGASADAAQAVNDGCRIAMNVSGGLHHAHRERAAGFCVFNDCVVAIHRLRARFRRVAYIDVDVHHGDGVQEAFYDDPDVLTVSIHQSGRTLFPGTGFAEETGVGAGAGFSVNVPIWPYADDATWLWAWREAALPIVNAFDPEVICLDIGADPHYLDPIAHLCLTAQGWLEAVRDVRALDKPVVALGGGGYNPTTVPRMWTLAFSVLFDVPLPDATPEDYPLHGQMPTLSDHEYPPIAFRDRQAARRHAEEAVAEVQGLFFDRFGLPRDKQAPSQQAETGPPQ